MSQENVDLVRRIYSLLDQGDEAVWDLAPPEVVFDFSRRLIDPVLLRGRDQVRAWADREAEIWEGRHTRWQPEELIDAGDKVLAFIRTGGRGKASGVEVQAYVWNVWTFRDGKPIEWTYFGEDRGAALEAVGLSEEMTLQANVDTIRRMVESANASGWDSESVVNNWVHPEGRMYPARDFPGPDVYVGREEMGAFIREWTSTFDDLRWELEQLIDLGDRVVVLARMVGKSRTTGTAIDWPFGGVFADFRDGTFAEARFFMDQKGALEAVGLSEQDAQG